MVGNIGTGKTVTARRLLKQFPNTLVIDIDALATMFGGGNYDVAMFAAQYHILYANALTALTECSFKCAFNAIVDATIMSKEKRKDFIKIAQKYGAYVKVYLHRTPGGLERRCDGGRGISHEIWKDVYRIFENEYEEPSLNEGINEIIDCTW